MNIPTSYKVDKTNPISNNIAFCYAVNENSGSILNDISGNGYYCQLMNNPSWLGNGILKFAGRQGTKTSPLPSQYGRVPSYNKTLSSATFLVIITIDEILYGNPGFIFSRNPSTVSGLNVHAGGDATYPPPNAPPGYDPRFFGPAAVGYHWNDMKETYLTSGPLITTGIKYLIAVTVSPSLATLYLYNYSTGQMLSVNNTLIHSPALLDTVELMRDSSRWDFVTSSDLPDTVRYVNGKLEFAVMWERALTSTEISQIASNPAVFLEAPVTCPELVNTLTITKG